MVTPEPSLSLSSHSSKDPAWSFARNAHSLLRCAELQTVVATKLPDSSASLNLFVHLQDKSGCTVQGGKWADHVHF